MKRKLLAAVVGMSILAMAMVGCGADKDGGGASSGDNKNVILITMDSTDQHWVAVDKGAKEVAEELGNITYKWMAPDKKDDAQQIERINNAMADNADVIMISANGPDAITAALEEAKEMGIKIIYVDSPANSEAEVLFATDNKAAGKTAGEEMIAALEAQGKTDGRIGIVNINASTQSTAQREEGFREAFEGLDFEILETQYGEGDAAKSQDIADNYITDGCVGIFGANEGSTVGVGNAVKGHGEEIIGVGFDQSDAILSLIEEGHLVATMAQNPDVMGSEGMRAAGKVLAGETIEEKVVDTGVSVIRK